jgi:REP-associated tyrosine transposase
VPRAKRKRIRLPSATYTEPGRTFSITIATSPKTPIFADISFGLKCLNYLEDLRDKMGLRIYAYCLMPDHVHLLAAMTSRASLVSAIGSWKSRCYQERRESIAPERFWQRSFYDRALRDNEDLLDSALYVLNNPVRAGLVKDFHDYPLCGSMEFEL